MTTAPSLSDRGAKSSGATLIRGSQITESSEIAPGSELTRWFLDSERGDAQALPGRA
jgi:hypothetical protein